MQEVRRTWLTPKVRVEFVFPVDTLQINQNSLAITILENRMSGKPNRQISFSVEVSKDMA